MEIVIDKEKFNRIFDTGDSANYLTDKEKLRILFHIESGLVSGRNICTMSGPVSFLESLTGHSSPINATVIARSRQAKNLDEILELIRDLSQDNNAIGIYKIYSLSGIPESVVSPLNFFSDEIYKTINKPEYEDLRVTNYYIRYSELKLEGDVNVK